MRPLMHEMVMDLPWVCLGCCSFTLEKRHHISSITRDIAFRESFADIVVSECLQYNSG